MNIIEIMRNDFPFFIFELPIPNVIFILSGHYNFTKYNSQPNDKWIIAKFLIKLISFLSSDHTKFFFCYSPTTVKIELKSFKFIENT